MLQKLGQDKGFSVQFLEVQMDITVRGFRLSKEFFFSGMWHFFLSQKIYLKSCNTCKRFYYLLLLAYLKQQKIAFLKPPFESKGLSYVHQVSIHLVMVEREIA